MSKNPNWAVSAKANLCILEEKPDYSNAKISTEETKDNKNKVKRKPSKETTKTLILNLKEIKIYKLSDK